MFLAENLSLKYGTRVLFDFVNITLNPGVRYGLVGANGCGKSSFLKILSGDMTPSGGGFIKPKHSKVGVLKQDYYRFENESIRNVVLMGREALWKEFKLKDHLLEQEEITEEVLNRLEKCEEAIQRLGGYEAESEASALLSGLGILESKHEDPLSTLSGGYKIRVLLAQLLFDQPDLLLLDEPTNYLDIGSIAWLEGYLKNFKGCTVICSHDRAFLNNVIDEVLDIDYERIKVYKGDYEDFSEQKMHDLMLLESSQSNLEKKEKHLESFVKRFGAKATKAAQAQSKKKLIEKIRLEKTALNQASSSRKYPNFSFKPPERCGVIPLEVLGIEKAFGPKQVLYDLSFEVQRGDKIAIVGPNGVGKSTLLEILTSNTSADRGDIKWGSGVKIGYFPQHFERELHQHQRPMDYLFFHHPEISEQKIRSSLGGVLFSKDDIEKSISQLSGGEKARLVLAKLILSEPNLILLDEPTNHLDLESCDSLVEAIEGFEGTVIVVSHNRFFITEIASRIFEISPKGFYDFKGRYEEYVEKRGLDFFTVKDFKNVKTEPPKTSQKKTEPIKNKNLDKEIKELEKSCENKESELAKLLSEMSSEGFFELATKQQLQDLSEKKEKIEKEITILYEKLEKLLLERDGF